MSGPVRLELPLMVRSVLSRSCDSDRTVLHTGISTNMNPVVAATPCANATATPQPAHEYDPLLWDVVINEIVWDEAEYH